MNTMLDVVGCGFGPSNLALEIAFRESGQISSGRRLFLERQPRFGWHRGLLLTGATMQVSFLKDLVTMRNPVSPFSFVAYLHARDRLADYINGQFIYPLRSEFHDYLEWAAARVHDNVRYGAEVVAVAPVRRRGAIEALEVHVRTPEGLECLRTRSLVIGTGLRPRLPDGVVPSAQVSHSETLLDAADAMARTGPPRRVAVVGGGQSAAEAVGYLHSRFTEAEVLAIFPRFGYSAADDSPFVNRIFDPDSVDRFYYASPEAKAKLLDDHRNTNYSAVDAELSHELFLRQYQERVSGPARLRTVNASVVRRVVEDSDGVTLSVESLSGGELQEVTVDATVFATGYLPVEPDELLGDLASRCLRDEHGRLRIGRDYRIVTAPELRCPIFVHGPTTESSHGISAGLLSTTAVRSGEIAAAVLRGLPPDAPAPSRGSGAQEVHVGART
jgi:L-ornithine N5-oxygenase